MIRKHMALLRPNPKLLSGALLSLIIAEIFPFCYPLILSQILDHSLQNFSTMIGIYVFVVVLHSFALYLRIYLGQKLSIQAAYQLRKTVFDHLQRLPVRYFQKTPIGNLMTRTTSDVEAYGNLFSEGLLELMSNLALLLFSIAFMLWQDWRLGLATLTFFPALTLVSAYYRSHFRSLQQRFRASLADLNAFLQESLNGIGMIQSFRQQSKMQAELATHNQTYIDLSLAYAKRYAGFFPIVQSLSDLSLLASYAAGLWLISGQQISAGTLVAFAWYASIYSRPLRDISDRVNTLQNSLAAGDRVQEFMDLPVEVSPLNTLEKREFPSNAHAIQFEHVEFSYLPDRPVLRDFSLQLPQGKTAALVGSTGCGKSTSLQILIGFNQIQSGVVSVFGTPLEQITKNSLHQQIAWLGQDPFLFSGTLKQNICMGLPYDPIQFEDVCTRAQLTQTLRQLTAKEETLVGTGGQELSTGQRQLVAYARTLYQNPAILLLDEPSASLDATTEHALHLALQELLRGRTTLIVTHRITSIFACERVFVMEAGHIVEEGTPSELSRSGGHFSRLFP